MENSSELPEVDAPEASLSPSVRNLAWILLGTWVLGHLIPYLPRYSMPHADYGNVLHVLNYLQGPHLFAGDRLTEVISHFFTTTAPVYFYGVAYPLSLLMPDKWALYFIGVITTTGCFYFAGGDWDKRKNLLVATLITFLLLHSTVSPLEGNRRSFTAFFILGMIWFEERNSYLGQMFLMALAGGVYPPAGLLILTYGGLREVLDFLQGGTNLRRGLLRVSGLGFVFAIVLMPYLMDIFVPGRFSGVSQLNSPIVYDFSSFIGFLKIFLGGGGEDILTRGAIFRDQIHLDFFLMLLTLLAVQRTLLGRKITVRTPFVLLGVASLLLWGLAHLVHPLIYHPFKYTRIGLLLAVAFPVFENLPSTSRLLRRQFAPQPLLRLAFVFMALWMLGVWGLHHYYTEKFSFLAVGGIFGPTWWKFVFVLPLFITILFVLPETVNVSVFRSLLAGVVLFVLVIVPHPTTTIEWRDYQLSDLSGLYEYLETTPPGTIVAGPPLFFMNFVPMYSSRGVYSSGILTSMDFVCDRNREFWQVYFSGSPGSIEDFMSSNNIDYLLVNRETVRERRAYGILTCNITITPARDPYLDRHFPGAAWNFGRDLYLISRSSLSQ